MTLQDTPAFNRAFNALAALYNLSDYEDRRLRYFQALSDIHIASLEGAFTEAAKRAGFGDCQFFPLPGTLRVFVSNASNVQRTSDPSPSCDKCGGTGMMTAEPDMERVRTVYGQEASAAVAQPIVTRCACRS